MCGVHPDLTTLGKIIGGGLPIGAIGGTKAIMEHLAPLGPVYQAGTLSGNPVAVASGKKTVELLRDEAPYLKMEILGRRMAKGIQQVADEKELNLHCAQRGGMFTPFFRKQPVTNLAESTACDQTAHARYFHHMLQHGFYTPPSGFEVAFISGIHTTNQIDAFIEALHQFDG
jgi:glutamate-1-semialdehyde 2,1-aminomutase